MPDQSFWIDIGGPGQEELDFTPAVPDDFDFTPAEPDFNYSDFVTGGMPDYGGGYAPEPDYSTYEPPQYGAPSGSGLWAPEPSRTQPTTGFGVPELANSGVDWDEWYNNLWMNQPVQDWTSRFAEEVAPSAGYYGGATRAAGDFLTSMSTPLNIATAGAGLVGRVPGMIAALPKIANIGRGVEAALSAPVAAHGVYQMARPGATPGQRIFGGVEALGGGLGLNPAIHPYGLGAPRPPAPAVSQIPTPNAEPFMPRGQLSFPDPSGQPGPYLGSVPPYAPSPQPLPLPPIRIPKTVISDTKRIKIPTPGIIAYWERLGYKKGKWLSMEEGGGLMMYKESTVWTDAPAPPPSLAQQPTPTTPQAPPTPPTQAVGQAVPPVTDFPKPLPGESLMKFQRRTQLPIDEARVFYEAAMRQAAPAPIPVQQAQPQLPIQPEPVAPPVQPTPPAPVPPRQLPERFTPRPGETLEQFQARNRLRTSAARELWDAAKSTPPPLPEAWQGMTGTAEAADIQGMIADSRRARALARTRDELGRFLKEDKAEWEVGAATSNLLKIMRGEATDTPLGRFLGEEKGAVALDDVTLAAEASKNFLRNTMGWGRGNAARRSPIIEGEMGTTILDEALGMAKNSMTIGDYSGLARQTYPTIYSKHFWTGIWPMIKSGWNEDAFRALDSKHRSLEAFKRPKDQAGNIGKSLADRSGIRLHEWGENLSKRGEQVASNWIENGAFLGPQMVKGYVNPVRAGYNQTLGRLARGSNRAFITIRNHVAANMFQDMVDNARDMAILAEDTGRTKFSPWKSGQGFLPQKVTPEQAFDMNPYTNDVLARDLADAVRTLVGDPPLRTHVLPHPGVELNLEKAADILSKVFFAPRLAMRQVRLLNPWTYVMAPPAARKEYMKSMLAMTAAWGTAMKGLSMAGVDIEWDMTSADFGKGRIGNTRFGPSTEFLPYLVLGARLWEGGYTSAATEPGGKGEWHEFGKGFGAGTAEELMQGLAVNKLEPVVKFAFDVANASEHKPFHVIDRSIGLFVAMSAQDLVGIAKESPGLAAMLSLPIIAGFGTQTYSRHEEKGKIWPSERDWVIKGGGIKHRLKEMGLPVEVRQQ